MKNTELAFCKFSKYPILKSIRVKFSRYKQKSMNVSVSFDTLILIYKKRSAQDAHCNCSGTDTEEKRKEEKHGTIYRAFVDGGRACDGCIRSVCL